VEEAAESDSGNRDAGHVAGRGFRQARRARRIHGLAADHGALDHFEKAKKLYLDCGRQADWDALAALVRDRHKRKSGFIPGFEAIVKGRFGRGGGRPESFESRARARPATCRNMTIPQIMDRC